MTKNKKQKWNTRQLAAAAGTNYTTALRSQTELMPTSTGPSTDQLVFRSFKDEIDMLVGSDVFDMVSVEAKDQWLEKAASALLSYPILDAARIDETTFLVYAVERFDGGTTDAMSGTCWVDLFFSGSMPTDLASPFASANMLVINDVDPVTDMAEVVLNEPMSVEFAFNAIVTRDVSGVDGFELLGADIPT